MLKTFVPHWSKADSFLRSHLDFRAYLSILSLASTLTKLKPSSTNMMESTLQKNNTKTLNTPEMLSKMFRVSSLLVWLISFNCFDFQQKILKVKWLICLSMKKFPLNILQVKTDNLRLGFIFKKFQEVWYWFKVWPEEAAA